MGMRLEPAQRERLAHIEGEGLEKLIRAGFARLLRAASARAPVVWVLDDLHWADQSSIELLESLLRLVEHIGRGAQPPALVVGLPVGFVNAAESKEALMALDLPYISNVGRKGGSNLAAAVVNALLEMAVDS